MPLILGMFKSNTIRLITCVFVFNKFMASSPLRATKIVCFFSKLLITRLNFIISIESSSIKSIFNKLFIINSLSIFIKYKEKNYFKII